MLRSTDYLNTITAIIKHDANYIIIANISTATTITDTSSDDVPRNIFSKMGISFLLTPSRLSSIRSISDNVD